VRVAFLIKDLQLSGGVGVVVTHARNLANDHGFDVTLVTTEAQDEPHWEYESLEHLHVATLAEARADRFDIAISTWWETAYGLFQLKAARYASFVQSIEDRFYESYQSVERLGARVTLDLPVSFITEASWIVETIRSIHPDAEIHLVRNGIDKATFEPAGGIDRRDEEPLRVLVEGNPASWFKGIDDSLKTVDLMEEPHRLTLVCPSTVGLRGRYLPRAIGPLAPGELADVYADTDVLLKLSRVEGMYGPPLEAFHKGATCITTEVTGSEEYIRHGENALFCDWDDRKGTAGLLDMLARDRDLLHRLRTGALQTAIAWPDWNRSSAGFAAALADIAASPKPPVDERIAAMMVTLRVGLEQERGLSGYYRKIRADAGRWQRVNSLPGVRAVLGARRSAKEALRSRRETDR
jgi:O-antigen biosynthesis protein